MKNVIYVNADKMRRSEDIYLLLTGKRPRETQMSVEHKAHLLERFTEMFADEKVDLKDKEASIDFIYKKLAGGTRTIEQQAKLKAQASKNKIGASKAKDAVETGEDDDDKDDE